MKSHGEYNKEAKSWKWWSMNMYTSVRQLLTINLCPQQRLNDQFSIVIESSTSTHHYHITKFGVGYILYLIILLYTLMHRLHLFASYSLQFKDLLHKENYMWFHRTPTTMVCNVSVESDGDWLVLWHVVHALPFDLCCNETIVFSFNSILYSSILLWLASKKSWKLFKFY